MNSMRSRRFVGIVVMVLLITACGESEMPSAQSSDDVGSTPTMMVKYQETVVPDEIVEIDLATPVDLTPTHSDGVAPENTAEPSSCSVGASASTISVSSPEILAWIADQVVIGTVVEQLPSEFGRELYPQGPSAIHTDYGFQVEARIRGEDHDVIYVRQPGGTVDECVVAYEDGPMLKVRDQLLLFLYDDMDAQQPTYGILGDGQGYWEILSDGRVEPLWPEVLASSEVDARGIGLKELVERLHTSLVSGSPPQQSGATLATPLDVAPVVAEVPDVSSILEALPARKP